MRAFRDWPRLELAPIRASAESPPRLGKGMAEIRASPPSQFQLRRRPRRGPKAGRLNAGHKPARALRRASGWYARNNTPHRRDQQQARPGPCVHVLPSRDCFPALSPHAPFPRRIEARRQHNPGQGATVYAVGDGQGCAPLCSTDRQGQQRRTPCRAPCPFASGRWGVG